jgi:hypothetical protein
LSILTNSTGLSIGAGAAATQAARDQVAPAIGARRAPTIAAYARRVAAYRPFLPPTPNST